MIRLLVPISRSWWPSIGQKFYFILFFFPPVLGVLSSLHLLTASFKLSTRSYFLMPCTCLAIYPSVILYTGFCTSLSSPFAFFTSHLWLFTIISPLHSLFAINNMAEDHPEIHCNYSDNSAVHSYSKIYHRHTICIGFWIYSAPTQSSSCCYMITCSGPQSHTKVASLLGIQQVSGPCVGRSRARYLPSHILL